MIAGWAVAATVLGVAAAQAEQAPTVRGLFEGAWTRAECNQPIDMALNNARYHELGGGYSLGMVLCWLGPNSESQILFLVAPKTGGKPQLIRLEEWIDKKFVPVDALPMADYDAAARRITSYRRYSARGICAAAGEWTWTGTEFKMTGYWDKPDCQDESEFDRTDRFRIFPPKK
ncbi:MAG: DUF1176 domain-containing protein [Xanthobacteraceae bacterium]|nr:DUF1176 domain-containing protein [Xanthobacteraceae bacterium]